MKNLQRGERCGECPAFRLARDSALKNAKDCTSDLPTMGDEGRLSGLDIFRKIGRAIAQKLSADDWQELRAVLLDDDGAAQDDTPPNGIERPRGAAMDSFARLFPNAGVVKHLSPTAQDERPVAVSDVARKSFAELYGVSA